MESEVKIKVKYELYDLLKFNFWSTRKQRRVFLCLLGFILFLMFTMFLMISFDKGMSNGLSIMINEYRFLLAWFIILLILGGMFNLVLYNTCKNMVRNNRIWSEEKDITINETGVYIKSDSATMNLLIGKVPS